MGDDFKVKFLGSTYARVMLMDVLLPNGIECEYEKKTQSLSYTCNIHTAYEALTNVDNKVLHFINVNVTSKKLSDIGEIYCRGVELA